MTKKKKIELIVPSSVNKHTTHTHNSPHKTKGQPKKNKQKCIHHRSANNHKKKAQNSKIGFLCGQKIKIKNKKKKAFR